MFDFFFDLFRSRRPVPVPAPATWPWPNPTDTVAEMYRDKLEKAESALREIVAMETPSCAHIGKRMAAAARNALPN